MSEPFIGQIQLFAGNFAPRNWALCDGQLLAISSYQALFSILGTTYGGDGRTSFALPDLRGRAAMHAGSGAGLTPRALGSRSGVETNTLSVNNLPAHSHVATTATNCVTDSGNTNEAVGNYWSKDLGSQSATYHTGAGATTGNMNAGAVTTSVANTGAGQAVNNMQPYLAVNYIIALQGVFPSRN